MSQKAYKNIKKKLPHHTFASEGVPIIGFIDDFFSLKLPPIHSVKRNVHDVLQYTLQKLSAKIKKFKSWFCC